MPDINKDYNRIKGTSLMRKITNDPWRYIAEKLTVLILKVVRKIKDETS